MPLYEYQAIESGCPYCATGFEVHQKMSDASLTHCPACGNAVEKKISAAAISKANPKLLSKKNLEKNGFLRYERSKDGTYVKTAGIQGPKILKKT